jgi:osmoprotectant transport system ATP-binding protein
MFELREISKSFGTTQAVRSLSLSVEPESTTVLIGPSGCGKSTLLRLMNGLVRPDAGEVRFENEGVTAETELRLRLRMGYVIQDGGLFPHLTARANVTLMARHLRWDNVRIEKRIGELIDLTRFPPDALDRFPQQLSGGQSQRVSLMRALMLDPDVLLLDEPLGALDPMIRADLQEELRGIFRRLAKTVVLVTHDLGEAGYLGDTIVLLRAGGIVQSGTFEELIASPATGFVSDFVQAQRKPWDATRGETT